MSLAVDIDPLPYATWIISSLDVIVLPGDAFTPLPVLLLSNLQNSRTRAELAESELAQLKARFADLEVESTGSPRTEEPDQKR